MKKILMLFLIVLSTFSFTLLVNAASVTPVERPGNDSNPNDYTPPEGCIHYEIPNSANEGTHTVRFNSDGMVDANGPFIFTIVVGIAPGNDYTEVLSWSSNFPIESVIVKGGPNFNIYSYDTGVRNDTSLVSPNVASGKPADISHVSVVICPNDIPDCPDCPICPEKPDCDTILLFTIILIVLSIFLISNLAILFIILFYCNKKCTHKGECFEKDDCRENNS
jgi:hypothetical protein